MFSQCAMPRDRCLPPVPRFDAEPSREANFSVCQAKICIKAALSEEIDGIEDRGRHGAGACASSLEALPRAKGARKRKARPTRSDDGCDIRPQRLPPAISTDQLFYSLLAQAAASTSIEPGAAQRKTCRGLTKHQAILASEKRRKDRQSKRLWFKQCSAIVSGVVVHLRPVTMASAVNGSHGALLIGQWQTDVAV